MPTTSTLQDNTKAEVQKKVNSKIRLLCNAYFEDDSIAKDTSHMGSSDFGFPLAASVTTKTPYADQFCPASATGIYIGNGLILTAGHCATKAMVHHDKTRLSPSGVLAAPSRRRKPTPDPFADSEEAQPADIVGRAAIAETFTDDFDAWKKNTHVVFGLKGKLDHSATTTFRAKSVFRIKR